MTQERSKPVAATRDLFVELGGSPVLRGITMSVEPGEALALLGGNGSGKSTLVRALLGLIPAQRGQVELFGEPVSRFRQWSRIGYVPQRSTASLSGAKVKEVVASGRLSRRAPFVPPRAADRVAVDDALAAVGLTDRAGDRLALLSGGQQQRVLIARALAGQPDLLVLDEPTAGVDLAHQQVLAELLDRLLHTGTAVVVVLHEAGALGTLIDRAVVLRDGRVTHDGPVGSLGTHHHHASGHEHETSVTDAGFFDQAAGA
ncbi:MAG TPA: metal ABC transporter ATP-binding protein [Propionibacteriaceae bacterium]